MLNRICLGVIAVLLVLSALGCSTKNVSQTVNPDRNASGFALNVWDDSYIDGASVGGFNIAVEDYGEDILVSVNVTDAVGLKALYFDMDYNADNYRPMIVADQGRMGGNDEVLMLEDFRTPGNLLYGMVQTNWDWREGYTGSGKLVEVVFTKETAINARTASAAPLNTGSMADLVWEDSTSTLSWHYFNTGDYDQNGDVTINDLTPLGANFKAVNGNPPTPWPVGNILSLIDGESNGELNISDVTPIGQFMGNSCRGGWTVYGSSSADDYPATPGAANGAGTATLNATPLQIADATGNPTQVRVLFEYVVAAHTPGTNYWVRPMDTSSNIGIASNLADTDITNNPVLTLTNEPAQGDGTSTVPFKPSTGVDYIFTLTDPTNGDAHVEADANTTWTVSNPAAGSIDTSVANQAILNIPATFTTGSFNVSANFNGQISNPTAIFFDMGAPPVTGEYLLPDTTDTDWGAPVTGSGTEADPYALDGTDDTKGYDFVLNTKDDGTGDARNVDDYTFHQYPPFNGTWTVNSGDNTATFVASFLASGYVYAQNDTSTDNTDNEIYLYFPGLPN